MSVLMCITVISWLQNNDMSVLDLLFSSYGWLYCSVPLSHWQPKYQQSDLKVELCSEKHCLLMSITQLRIHLKVNTVAESAIT